LLDFLDFRIESALIGDFFNGLFLSCSTVSLPQLEGLLVDHHQELLNTA
ncbi:hypothetical protein T4A_12853, partial [Trichinella pseudospiralis]